MTIVKDFDSCDENTRYFYNNYQLYKQIQSTFDGNRVLEAVQMNVKGKPKVIIKCIQRKNDIFDNVLNLYVNREFFFLKLLQNTEFCPIVYEYLQCSSCCYIVMQKLTDQWKLFTELVGKIENINNLKKIFKNIASTLLSMNKLGIFYMDIKLENIMVNIETQGVKFIDFEDSFYSPRSPDPHRSGLIGTLGYCSPEIFTNQIYSIRKCQVFSFGCLLYTCLESKLPFINEQQTKNLIFPKMITMHRNAVDVIEICFQRNHSQRPYLEDILQHFWFRCVDE